MNEFEKQIEKTFKELLELSKQWEQLNKEDYEKINQSYPFDFDFEDFLVTFSFWNENVKKTFNK